MVIQLVPFDCNIENFPAVAARIAVPAVADPSGTTFELAEVTEFAVIFFNRKIRPGNDAAAGRVKVLFVVVKISVESRVETVYVAALIVDGF